MNKKFAPIDGEEIVEFTKPSEEIFKKSERYINLIKTILPESKVTLIGSLSIPIRIQNEIDLLVEIGVDEDIESVQEKIRDYNPDLFGIGPIDKGEGYSRTKKKHGLICELHILNKGDKRIDKYLEQVRRFKSEPKLSEAYDLFKKEMSGSPRKIYKEKKNEFFKKHKL